MKLIFSPHPDDAFLSLGGAMLNWAKEGEKVKIVDFFTVSNYTNKGLLDAYYVTSVRANEDSKAAKLCNAEVEFLNFTDSFLRGYKEAPYPTKINWDLDKDMLGRIKGEIAKRAKGNECYFPLGIGHHVDHLLVREAAHQLIKENKIKKYYFYEEMYYAAKYHFVTDFAKSIHLVPKLVRINFDEKQKVLDVYKSQVEADWNLIRQYSNSITKDGFHERIWG